MRRLARALPACLAAALWAARARLQDAWRVLDKLRPVVLAADDLEERLAGLPRRKLTPSEIQAFERDGLLILRGVLPDRGLLREMLPALRQHQAITSAVYTQPWAYNGAARALLGSGLITGVVMQLHKSPGQLQQAPIWGTDGVDRYMSQAWHQDLPLEAGTCNIRMVTAWLAITHAPHALEFLRGTTDCSVRADLTRRCNMSRLKGKAGERLLEDACLQRHGKEVLDPALGYSAYGWVDLEAGDLALFHGNIAHRSIAWSRQRLAVSVRVTDPPQTQPCSLDGRDFMPPGGGSHLDFRCLRQWLLPRPFDLWPKWEADRLPPGPALAARHAWLRWAAAGLGRALLWV